jgi:hypothetical protein
LATKLNLTAEESLNLSDLQQLYWLTAKDSINEIDKGYVQTKESGQFAIRGAEFSFGLNVLIKLPVSDIHQIKEHLASLTMKARPLISPPR